MIKRFGFHSNSRDADVVDDLPTSIDFQAQKDGVVTPVWYYISMHEQNIYKSKSVTLNELIDILMYLSQGN